MASRVRSVRTEYTVHLHTEIINNTKHMFSSMIHWGSLSVLCYMSMMEAQAERDRMAFSLITGLGLPLIYHHSPDGKGQKS
jgi:hypothetical protein